jgi:hypothetical protein
VLGFDLKYNGPSFRFKFSLEYGVRPVKSFTLIYDYLLISKYQSADLCIICQYGLKLESYKLLLVLRVCKNY